MRKSVHQRDETGADFQVALFIDSQQFVEVVFVDQHSGG
jgi:hypothetical protein